MALEEVIKDFPGASAHSIKDMMAQVPTLPVLAYQAVTLALTLTAHHPNTRSICRSTKTLRGHSRGIF